MNILGLEQLDNAQAQAVSLAVEALMCDGEHHKQWYLERIIESLGIDIVPMRNHLAAQGYEFDEGIAP